MGLFKTIIADQYNSKLERVLRYSIHILLGNEQFNLINLRKANKLTQLELAQKLNYSDKAISKWERGDSMPDILLFKELKPNRLESKRYCQLLKPSKPPPIAGTSPQAFCKSSSIYAFWGEFFEQNQPPRQT